MKKREADGPAIVAVVVAAPVPSNEKPDEI